MLEVLKNKNLATRFQILVEIAARGPNIQQRAIARQLEITPQAVSDYISQLSREGMLESGGRSRYSLTPRAVNWVIEKLKEIDEYSLTIQKAVSGISVCAAIAGEPLRAGQQVNIQMENGLLVAVAERGGQARGNAVSDAETGQDIGVSNISGIVPLNVGTIQLFIIPSIDKGGSRLVDERLLLDAAGKYRPVISAGLESYALLTRMGIDFYRYGASEAAIEAAMGGQEPLVICPDNEAAGLMRRFEEARVDYRKISGTRPA